MSRFDQEREKKRYEGENVYLRLSKYLLKFPLSGLFALGLVIASNAFALIGPTSRARPLTPSDTIP